MRMFADLSGRVAFVTGSSRGLGAAIARGLSEAGAAVTIAYHKSEADAQRLCKELEELGRQVAVRQLDVTSRDSVREAIRGAVERFGRLDILVNNAGALRWQPLEEITEEDWQQMLDVNARAVLVCAQEALPFLRATKGTITNLTSVGGQTGGTRGPHYAASKAAVISLTRSLARLLAPDGIRVNAVSPGYIETEMLAKVSGADGFASLAKEVPLGRIGLPADVANAVRFLASDAASYITGQVLNLNGGTYLG
jgi:3-oxoacyl-[acyl-carrier protein] reductase